ncbi:MAG: nucleotidyltransferase domain-containing protein [Pseudomonadota bacterium]
MTACLPEVWVNTIRRWALKEPLIEAVFVFGSRAKGTERVDSDLDIALLVRGADGGERLANWVCEAEDWAEELSTRLPVKLDLQSINPDDSTVGPAVAEHGLCILDKRLSE